MASLLAETKLHIPKPGHGPAAIATAPILLWELSLGVWLAERTKS